MKKFGQTSIYRVRSFVHPFQHLYHFSNLCSGLCLLANRGVARIDFKQPAASANYASDPGALWMEALDLRTGEDRKIVFDMYDASNVFAIDSLQLCDVYFKRSYHPPDLHQLSPKLQAKVLSFGLNYACQTPQATVRVLSTLLPSWTWRMLKSPVQTIRRLRATSLKLFLTNPDISAFEQLPDRPLRRAVHFETRVWDQRDLGPNSDDEINRPRVELIRLLKKEFGTLFDGGIVRTKYAFRYCPTELSRHPSTRRRYVARSKQMLIGVYTGGLHHSTAFKLGEYLAGSKCIVSESFRNQLPTPLVAGRNYLEFSSPQECLERCRQILNDEELANQMRRDNWEYYQREVRPDRHVANCLERAFAR